MWGFITLFIGTVLISVEYDIFQKLLGRSHGFWVGSFFLGYELVLDVMGALFLVGLLIALVRRYLLRRPQLTWKPLDLLLPVWLLLIGLTGFWVEGMRLAATTGRTGLFALLVSDRIYRFERLARSRSSDDSRLALVYVVVSRRPRVGLGRCVPVWTQSNAHPDCRNKCPPARPPSPGSPGSG